MKKILIIVRGVPGCGKSTFAELLVPQYAICTADDHHIKDGVYVWKPENIAMSHTRCQEK